MEAKLEKGISVREKSSLGERKMQAYMFEMLEYVFGAGEELGRFHVVVKVVNEVSVGICAELRVETDVEGGEFKHEWPCLLEQLSVSQQYRCGVDGARLA